MSRLYSPLHWKIPPSSLGFGDKLLIGFGSLCPYNALKQEIAQQLKFRKGDVIDAWPNEPRLRTMLTYASEQIHKWLEWPNAFFIPADPCEMLFWDSTVGLEGVGCLKQFERDLLLPANLFDDLATIQYGVLIDRLLQYGNSSIEAK